MSIPVISDHVAAALGRLITQYANAPNIRGLIAALVGPFQDIETAIAQLNELRMITVATGVNLDNIGKIVGLARVPGDSDDQYRQLLYGEIKVNTSQGQPEQVIQTFQIFTGAPIVILDEFFPGEFQVESEYLPASQAEANNLLKLLERVAPAGVRADFIVAYSPTAAFSYDGPLPGQGYGNGSDLTQGGAYPRVFDYQLPFAYAGDDPTAAGYGDTADPLVGGVYLT